MKKNLRKLLLSALVIFLLCIQTMTPAFAGESFSDTPTETIVFEQSDESVTLPEENADNPETPDPALSELLQPELSAEPEITLDTDVTEEPEISEDSDVSEEPEILANEETADELENEESDDPVSDNEDALEPEESADEEESLLVEPFEQEISSDNPDAEESEYDTGLYDIDGTWKYYENGSFKKATGLVRRPSDGKWFYVEKGIFNRATGLVRRVSDGKWFYVRKGAFNKATGMVRRVSDGKWFFVRKGVFAKATGMVKRVSDGKWFFVRKGVFNKATGMVRRLSDGKWFYVRRGVHKKSTGMVRRVSDGKWFYVKNGVHKKATGVTKRVSDGKLFYVKNGCFSKATGVAKSLFNNKWYYVKKGVFKKNTLFAQRADKANAKYFYVAKGIVQDTVPSPELDVQSHGYDHSRLMVTWKEVPGADGYYVYRSTNADTGFKLVNITDTACRYLDSGLSSNTTYYYWVRAYIGNPFAAAHEKTFVSSSGVDYAKTGTYSTKVHYTSYISPTSSNTVLVRSLSAAAGKEIYERLEEGYNFYVYVYNTSSNYQIRQLISYVRKISDWGIGFQYIRSYSSGNGRYYLIDAETYYYVKKYIKQAYTERMAEYKIYLDSGCDRDYYYTCKNETT